MIQVDPKYGWVLKRWKWTVGGKGYPCAKPFWRMGDKMTWTLHRYLWQLEHGSCPPQIDHDNQDKLDNRLCNLRPANSGLNGHNKSTRKKKSDLPMGVRYLETYSSGVPRKKPYQVQMRAHGFNNSLGYFATPEEASAAYQEAKEVLMEFHQLKSEAGFYDN